MENKELTIQEEINEEISDDELDNVTGGLKRVSHPQPLPVPTPGRLPVPGFEEDN